MYSSYLKYGQKLDTQNFFSNSIQSKNHSNKNHCDCLNCLINCVQYKFILQVFQDKKSSKKNIFFIADKENISSPLFFYEIPSNEIIDLIQNKNISENLLSFSQKIKSENDIINNFDQNKKNKILLFNYLKFPLININEESNIKNQSTIIILDDGKYDEISNYSIKSYSTFNKNYCLLFDIHNLKKADFLFTLDDIKDCKEIIFKFNGDIHGHKLFKNDTICSLNPDFIINSIKTRMGKYFDLTDKEIIKNLYDKFFFSKINDKNRNNIGILFSFNNTNTRDINKIKLDKDYILKENFRINKLFMCVDMWINNNNIETKDTSKSISIITKISNPKQEGEKKQNYKNDNNNNTDNKYRKINNNNSNNNYYRNYKEFSDNNYIYNNYMTNNNNYFYGYNNKYNNNYIEYNNNYNEYNNNYSEYNNNYKEYNNNCVEYNNYFDEYNNNYSQYNYNYNENENKINSYYNNYDNYNNYNMRYEYNKFSSSFSNYKDISKQSIKEENIQYFTNNNRFYNKNFYNNIYKNNLENNEYLENLRLDKYGLNALFNKIENSENKETTSRASFLKEEINADIKSENLNYNKSYFLDLDKKLIKELFEKYKQDNCISNYNILKKKIGINMNIEREKLKKIKLKYFFYCFKDINNLTINIPFINKRGKLFLNEFCPTLSSMRLILKINNKKIINKLKNKKKENFNLNKIKQNILKIEYQEIKPPHERNLLYNKINDLVQILGENRLTFNNVLADKSFFCILWNPANNNISNSSFLTYYSFDLKLLGVLIIKLNSFQWLSSFSNDINNFKDYKKEYNKNVENIKRFFKNLVVDKEEGYYKNFVSDDYMHYIKNSNI